MIPLFQSRIRYIRTQITDLQATIARTMDGYPSTPMGLSEDILKEIQKTTAEYQKAGKQLQRLSMWIESDFGEYQDQLERGDF